jgi:site-specific recombinase XerD
MNIDLIYPEQASVPIPIVRETGEVHPHFTEFLIRRRYYPALINPAYSSIEHESIKQKANQIRRFLENAEHNGYNYLEMSHEDIKSLLEALCATHRDSKTYNTMFSNVREFYEFLDTKGVFNKASFPARVTKVRKIDQSQNILSHTASSNSEHFEGNPDTKSVQEKTDFKENVFSIEQQKILFDKLDEIDPVYTVMAKVMLDTLLRRSNVCEMPFRKDARNLFDVYPVMLRNNNNKQVFHANLKGNLVKPITIFIHTWKMIYDEYINKYFDERKILFTQKYLIRTNGTLNFTKHTARRVPSDALWLKRTGAPVKPHDVSNAFTQAGLNITPHDCRHTGVTRTLEVFCEINGITPSEALSGRFLQLLQKMLGHADSKTTLMYIHTIQEQEIHNGLIHTLPSNIEDINRSLMPFVPQQVLERLRVDWYDKGQGS